MRVLFRSRLHFPSARAAQALPGTVPCGARTFLGTLSDDATAWPTPPRPLSHVARPGSGEPWPSSVLPGRRCEAAAAGPAVAVAVDLDLQGPLRSGGRSEEHTSELQSLMRIS